MPSAKRFARLDQLLAGLGYGSRREIDIAIRQNRIQVEGIAKPKGELRIDPALIRVDGEALDHPEGLLVVLHKPCGFVCSHASAEGPTVYDLLPPRWKVRAPTLETIGRLDKDTSGLLVLTDRHDWIHQLTSPKNHVPKVYEADIEANVTPAMISLFASGTLVLGGEEKPCLAAQLESISSSRARITLNEGRYHQVRRMLGSVGAPVLQLHRTRFGALGLDGLEESKYRVLRPELSTVTGER